MRARNQSANDAKVFFVLIVVLFLNFLPSSSPLRRQGPSFFCLGFDVKLDPRFCGDDGERSKYNGSVS